MEPKSPTRASELKAWLALRQIKNIDIAKVLGLSPQRTSQLLQGMYLSPRLRKRLVDEVGIPKYLLPPEKT